MTLVRRNKIIRIKVGGDDVHSEQERFINEFYPQHPDIPLVSPAQLEKKIKKPTEKNAFFLCHYSAQRINEQPTDELVTQTADHWLTIFMDNCPDDHTVACVFRCWLLEYRLPLTPSRLKTWTRFHQQVASIIADSSAAGTQSNKLDELLSDQYRRSHGLPCKRSPSKKSKVSAY